MQRQNLQFAEKQTALKLSWNSLDLVDRASREIVLRPSRLPPGRAGSWSKGWKSGKPSRNNHIKARELYYGNCLMSIVISTFGRGIFFTLTGVRSGGNVSQRRQLFPYLNLLECLFEGAFDVNARDRVECQLNSLAPQWRRLPGSLFSAKRVSRNESQRKRICA